MHLPMKVKSKKEKLMVWVFLLFQMDLLMKAKLKKIKFMARESIQMLKEKFMRESLDTES